MPEGTTNFVIDFQRFSRVVSKTVRGLYFVETDEILPPDIEVRVELFMPTVRVPEQWVTLINHSLNWEEKGNHLDVFSYSRYLDGPIHLWLVLIWENILIGAMYEAPAVSASSATD